MFVSLNDLEVNLSAASPAISSMTKTVHNAKITKRNWDADKALRSTYDGLFGQHQLRAYILLALGYGIVGAWLTSMPIFACRKHRTNLSVPSFDPI